MDLGLNGAKAVISGGTQGIGLAVAKELMAEGVSVSIAARRQEGVDAALEELRGLMELLESDDITVDTLTQAIRRAAVLLKHCQLQLHATEDEVKALMEELGVQSNGTPYERD